MSRLYSKAFFCLLALSVATLPALGEGKKIDKKDLTASALQTLNEQAPNATANSYSLIKIGNYTYFSVALTVSGHSKKVVIAHDGLLIESLDEITLDSVPGAAKTVLQGKAKKATLKKVYSITQRHKVVGYEGDFDKGGKPAIERITPDGKTLEDL